jgi:transitional endoplasmic reticulum ATPase
MKQTDIELKVSEAFQQDVGYGRARIDNQTRIDLDLSIGDVIEIQGTKTTAAVVWRAHPTDEDHQNRQSYKEKCRVRIRRSC